VDGGTWVNTSAIRNAVPAWKPRALLTGGLLSGGAALRFQLKGDAPAGMDRNGRVTLSDMMGRVKLDRNVETTGLSRGEGLQVAGVSGLSKGFYRARLQAGSVNLTCAVFVNPRD
jgi:hypothetical protein